MSAGSFMMGLFFGVVFVGGIVGFALVMQEFEKRNQDLEKQLKDLAQLVKETVAIQEGVPEVCTDKMEFEEVLYPGGKEAKILSEEKAIELVRLADECLERLNQEQAKGKKKA